MMNTKTYLKTFSEVSELVSEKYHLRLERNLDSWAVVLEGDPNVNFVQLLPIYQYALDHNLAFKVVKLTSDWLRIDITPVKSVVIK